MTNDLPQKMIVLKAKNDLKLFPLIIKYNENNKIKHDDTPIVPLYIIYTQFINGECKKELSLST